MLTISERLDLLDIPFGFLGSAFSLKLALVFSIRVSASGWGSVGVRGCQYTLRACSKCAVPLELFKRLSNQASVIRLPNTACAAA